MGRALNIFNQPIFIFYFFAYLTDFALVTHPVNKLLCDASYRKVCKSILISNIIAFSNILLWKSPQKKLVFFFENATIYNILYRK